MHGLVASLARSIFAQPDAESVREQHHRIVEQLMPRFSEAAKILVDARDELLAFTAFPTEHWRRIWSNNPQERLNREIRSRSDVVGIFPDRASLIRFVGALLGERHDDWAVIRRYVTFDVQPKEEQPKLEGNVKRAT
jgi:transposase-like protein